jgi:hypothetical protein
VSEPSARNDNSIARIAVVRGPVEVSLDAENDAVDLVVEPNLAVDERDATSATPIIDTQVIATTVGATRVARVAAFRDKAVDVAACHREVSQGAVGILALT